MFPMLNRLKEFERFVNHCIQFYSDLQQTAFKPFWNWSWLTSVFSPFCCVSWSTFPHQLTSLCALLIWASFPFPPTHSAGTEVDRLPQSRSPQHSSSHVTDPDPLSNSTKFYVLNIQLNLQERFHQMTSVWGWALRPPYWTRGSC